MDLDRMDVAVGGPMRVHRRGQVFTLPAASDLPWRLVAGAVVNEAIFMGFIWPEQSMKVGHLRRAQRAWTAHNDLPEPEQLRRLTYTMEKWGEAIDVDLRKHFGLSAFTLWRERRWSDLLRLIDHLPQDSHMNRLLTNDEEYMTQVLKKKKGGTGPTPPSMADWSLTNSMLAQLIDAVNKNTATTVGVANPKAPQPKIDPYPRPATVSEKIERRLQKQAHEEMVGLLLPGRA